MFVRLVVELVLCLIMSLLSLKVKKMPRSVHFLEIFGHVFKAIDVGRKMKWKWRR